MKVFTETAIMAAGNMSRSFIERAIVVPAYVRMLGSTAAGEFIWYYSIFAWLGQFCAGGLTDSLIRLYRPDDARRWNGMLWAAARLTVALSGVAVVGGWAFLALSGRYAGIWPLGLGCYFVLLAVRSVLQTGFRVDLRFQAMALVELVAGISLLLAPLGCATIGVPGAALGYALAGAVPLIVSSQWLKNRVTSGERPEYRWFLGTSSAFVALSTAAVGVQQAPRIVLGLLGQNDAVTTLLAGDTVVALMLTPTGYLGATVYSYLAKKRTAQDVSADTRLQYGLLAIATSLCIAAAPLVIGELALRALFPEVAQAARLPLVWLAIGGAGTNLQYMCRGFVYRFRPVRHFLSLGLAQLGVLATALFALVGSGGAIAAARVAGITNLGFGLFWFALFALNSQPQEQKLHDQVR